MPDKLLRVRIRHVLVDDGSGRTPGWWLVNTNKRPAATVAGPFDNRDAALAALNRDYSIPRTNTRPLFEFVGGNWPGKEGS
jgi:hypothetical protein